MTETGTAPENPQPAVDAAKQAERRKRRLRKQLLILLSIPAMVLVIGSIASWWRPVSLLLLCPVLKVMGRPEMAEPLAKRAVELYLKEEGPNSKFTMWAVWNLAETYRELGKYKKAEPLYKGLAEYNRTHQGEEAVMPFQTLTNYAKTLRMLGRDKDAELAEQMAKEEAKKARSR